MAMHWEFFIYAALWSLTGIGVWQYAYRLGFKHGRSSMIPFPLLDELLDHRIGCLGQDASEAQAEVETSLGIGE
jgi:hypothetical protein